MEEMLAQERFEEEDTKKVNKATRKSSDKTKKRRKTIETIQRHERVRHRGQEGVQYAPKVF